MTKIIVNSHVKNVVGKYKKKKRAFFSLLPEEENFPSDLVLGYSLFLNRLKLKASAIFLAFCLIGLKHT